VKPEPADSEGGPAHRREWLLTAALILALLVAYYALPMAGRWWPLPAVAGPVAICALGPISLRQQKAILTSARPLSSVIRAILIMGTLLIVGFAATYYAVDQQMSGQISGLETKTDAMYYTVTILATVGFGDILPTGQFARALTTFHMLANLIVVTVSVRLVIEAGRRRLAPSKSPDQGDVGRAASRER
jgi:voltage-gated potassium channel